MVQGYCKVKDGAKYAGVSERTFWNWLKDGLESTRPRDKKTLLIKIEWIDEYLARYKDKGGQIKKLANEANEAIANKALMGLQ